MPTQRLQASILGVLMLGAIHCGNQPGAGPPTTGQDEVQYFESGADFAGSHILVAYQGAQRAAAEITRSKEEAREKAQELISQLQRDPSRFVELAAAESDGPSGPKGGSLGSWKKGRMVAEFDTAIEKLEVGGITPEPVETGFGFHVILREETRQPLWAAWGLIIAWDGATQVTPRQSRTKEAAQQLAQDLQSRLNSGNFAVECKELNDTGPDPTFIGPLPKEAAANPVTARLLETIQPLHFDEVAGPVETPSGFAFLKRIKLDQRSGSHILIAYKGAQGADETVTRTKEEALLKAEELINRLEDDASDFQHLAREESDGISARNGGNLGVWFKGRMTPEFDIAMDRMEIGEISSRPVETPFGFHIIQRRAPVPSGSQ